MRTWSLALATFIVACSSDTFGTAPDAGRDVVTADADAAIDCGDTKSDPKNCGECGHGCGLNGQCSGGVCAAETFFGANAASCVDLDVQTVFWAGGSTPGKAPKAAPGTVTVGDPNAFDACRLVGASLMGLHEPSGQVVALNASDLKLQLAVASGQMGATGFTALGSTGFAWVVPSTGKVLACAKPPCGAAPMEIATNEPKPTAIAADAAFVYWAALGVATNDGAIKRRVLTATSPTQELAKNVARPVAIAVDGNEVFFGTEDGAIFSLPKGGGGPKPLAKDDAPGAYHMAVDLNYVYWTNIGGGTVNRVKKSGGPLVRLAVQQDKPWDITLDATHVYWTRNSVGGGVFRVPK